MRKRGEFDKNDKLCRFADELEKASLDTIESGVMTKDLALLWEGEKPEAVTTDEFIAAIAGRLHKIYD